MNKLDILDKYIEIINKFGNISLFTLLDNYPTS